MKAFLEIEVFDDHIHPLIKVHKSLMNNKMPGLGDDTIGDIKPNVWVAEITGLHEKYGYARTFLKAKKDYSRSNKNGSQGVFLEYILESSRIYDVKSNKDRYFCTVAENGNIKVISKDIVIAKFGEPSKQNVNQVKNKGVWEELHFASPSLRNIVMTNRKLTDDQIEYLKYLKESALIEAKKEICIMESRYPNETRLSLSAGACRQINLIDRGIVGIWNRFTAQLLFYNGYVDIYNLYANYYGKKKWHTIISQDFLEGGWARG